MGNVNNSFYNEAVNELEKDFCDILPSGLEGLGTVEGLSEIGIDRLISEVISVIGGEGGRVIGFFLMLLGAVMLSCLASAVPSGMSAIVEGGVRAAVSGAIFSAVCPLLSSVSEALSGITEFFTLLAPLITSLIAMGGGVGAAASGGYGMSITLWLTGILAGGTLPAILAAVLAISTISVSVGGAAESISKNVGSLLSRLVGIVGAVIAAVFALQTFVSSSADSLGMRAAKYAAGALVPTVGATVSGALSTLVGGLSYTGSLIGASSVAVIMIMALSPLALLLLYRLAFFLAYLIAEAVGRGGARCIAPFQSALDTLISVYVMTILIYIFEIIMMIWGGERIFGA